MAGAIAPRSRLRSLWRWRTKIRSHAASESKTMCDNSPSSDCSSVENEVTTMATQGKTAIVTGAGTGIGKGVALALLGEGYRVVFAGRRKEALDAAIAESGASRERALAVPTDVSDPAEVKALFAKTKEVFGRL